MVVESKDLYLLDHYEYGEAFYGSVSGMYYRVNRAPLKNVKFAKPEEKADGKLKAYVWPGPKIMSKTDPALVISETFEYSNEGKEAVAAWISKQYEDRKEEWEAIAHKGLFG